MNEIVVIKEGGLTRRLAPVDKLKINTTDNKESMWIPTGNANIGVLHASENGIYIASEDGYEAYSEVIVRVTKDSFDGDTSFEDWDYETPDMDLSNWDPETIEDFELDPDGFNDVFNNPDEWKDIDKPIDIKMENPKIQDTKISGIDPITGNEMEVGLDADGYLTESILPSSIKIEVLPSKLQYVEGQQIYLRGIVVKAYTEDGNLWTDSAHPDGIIPENELECDPTTAILDQSGSLITNISNAGQLIGYLKDPRFPGHRDFIKKYDGEAYVTMISTPSIYGGRYYIEPILFGKTANSVQFTPIDRSPSGDFDWNRPDSFAILNGYYYANGYGFDEENATTDLPVFGKFNSTQEAAEAIIEVISSGQAEGQATITVMYTRSDGEVLTDSYTIEVLPAPDGTRPASAPSAIEYDGSYYVANDDLNAEAHYASGTVWNRNTGAIYNTRDAVALGMLIPDNGNGSQHEGGDF